jgi:3,4-dihydroxy 2-butanone 4-phosphate synthase / GTP cyclohydrolase II
MKTTHFFLENPMSTSLIEKVRNLVTVGGLSRSGLARAAGLHANTLRDLDEADWNPTAETLRKLETYLFANDDTPTLVPIEEIIEEARNGRMFILVDDEDRENEGDLIIPAQMATPDAINFMATHGRGLICLAMTKMRVDQLGLAPMASENRESMETAFTVSIEAKDGVTTGISAADRARTVSVAVDASKGPADIVSPGHVFPLTARDGGVLVRAGHTEAAVDISRLAGLNASGVICEIMKDDGTMARMDDLVSFARLHSLKMGTIRDLIAYRMRNDHLVEKASESVFHSDYGGDWKAMTYRNKIDGTVNVVLQKGRVVPDEPTLVRMHRISIFNDLLGQVGSKKRMLQRAMGEIGAAGAGLIVLLTQGTPEALTQEIGGKEYAQMDLRTYGIGAQILADLGVHDMILLTNAHRNVVGLDGYGINIVGERAIPDA